MTSLPATDSWAVTSFSPRFPAPCPQEPLAQNCTPGERSELVGRGGGGTTQPGPEGAGVLPLPIRDITGRAQSQ